jgi:hypothetical protein
MAIYTLLFISISSALLLSKFLNKTFKFLAVLLLLAFSAFRENVGVDYSSYLSYFNSFRDGNVPFDFEPLNMLIIKIITLLNFPNESIFAIYSCITILSISYFIKKSSINYELSLFIFFTLGIFYFSTFNGIRQWVAISIILISFIKYAEDKKRLSFLLYILATMFHFSAVIFILLPLFFYRFSLRILILIFTGSIFVTHLLLLLIQYTSYGMYLNDLTFTKKGNTVFLLLYFISLIIIIIFLGYFKRQKQLDKRIIFLLNMNLASIYFFVLGYFLLHLDFLSVMRLNMYFEMQLIVLIPMVLEKIYNKYLKLNLTYLSIIFFSAYYFYLLFTKGKIYHLIPYNILVF